MYQKNATAMGKKRVWRNRLTTPHEEYTSAPVQRIHKNGARIPISTIMTPYPSSTQMSSWRLPKILATYCPPSEAVPMPLPTTQCGPSKAPSKLRIG